jgi:histone-lysine N-methyltransferase SETD1
VNKQKKIVIYAIRNIQPREEITYDYKFPLAKDEVLGIACLCSSKQCKRKNASKCIIPILHLVLLTI